MPRQHFAGSFLRRRRRALPWLLGACLLAVVSPQAVGAQPAVQAAMERSGPISPEKRAELYRDLQRHAQILEAQSAVVKTVAKLIGPTVVHIEADLPPRRGRSRRLEETGSGVVIDWKGQQYVLTNRHVIRSSPPDTIKINLADGRQIFPVKVWEDPATDVAVMAVSAPNLVAAPLGDSDKLEIGDFVLAVGSPFGLSHSVTYGIISAKGRRDLRLGDAAVQFQDFIQTDAAINPGNSGGPLVNLRGEIIGINTAIASNSGGSEGIGFAIPINMFMIVGRQLIDRGKVSRAFLGVNLNSKFTPAVAAEIGLPCLAGAQVTGITQDSPAEAAHVQVGDVILQYNHVPVEDDAHLVNMVSLTEVGTVVPLTIFRDGQTITIKVEVTDRSKFPQPTN